MSGKDYFSYRVCTFYQSIDGDDGGDGNNDDDDESLSRKAFVCFCFTPKKLFQLDHGGDMMYEMRRRKLEPTLFLTQGIDNLPHHIGMVREELAFDDAVNTAGKWITAQLNIIAVTGIRTRLQGHLPHTSQLS